MRRRGPAKQRLWLGPDRYFRRDRRRHTNANANANCHANRIADAHRNGYGITDSHTATEPYTQRWANSEAASHTFAAAIDFREPRVLLRL